MMFKEPHTTASVHRLDYFTIPIPVGFEHFSDETPTPCTSPLIPDDSTSAQPQHPLLAYRRHLPTPLSPGMASNLMHLQTAAAHPTKRPKPQPVQNVLHVTSDDSDSSNSSSSNSHISSVEFARCSRCQRTPSIDFKTGKSNMVSYGLNLWYCSRCAALVGFNR